ncbi:MAG: hypothetical protein ACJ0K4_12530 [Verrucomicrobiales bacterium]
MGYVTGWHENGQKGSEENYKDGKQDGLWCGGMKTGRRRWKETTRTASRMGYQEWHENGQKRTEGNCKTASTMGYWRLA